MVPSSQITAPTSQQQPRSAQPNVFEFTKRKKWADILVTELPETVLFILDSSRRIQYSGAGVREMLGWEVETLVDSDVLDLINDDDKQGFRDRFQISLNSQQELSCYARLKCKLGFSGSEQGASSKELLFEIRGHALYIQDDSECKCFFFMAKPYPSRNMAILNTFLELKIENERLTQRLYELKAQQEVHPISSLPLSSSVSSMSHSQFTPYIFAGPSDEALPGPSTRVSFNTRMSGNANFMHSHASTANTRDEQEEEGGKRKKPKKSHLMDHQYVCVTCGRTDSPEWRKGPKGPKTLCNACGLRWAKRAKKADDVHIPGYGQVTGHDSQGPQGGQDIPRVPASGSGSSANRVGRGAPVPHAALSVTPTTSNTNSVSSHHSQQSQHSQHSVQVHPQTSHAPSSAHISLNHAPRFQPSTTIPMSASEHYSDHSPHVASSLHHSDPHSSAPTHGYQASHDLYQDTYEQYAPWLANQPHGGYPGY